MNINIREKLDENVNKLLREFIDRAEKQQRESFYSGKVINNNDPNKNGRCRIRVFGVYGDEINDNDIPWATPDFNFIGSTIGSFVVPPIDAIVKVYFDQGDIYLPRYTTKVFESGKLPLQKDIHYPDNMVLFSTDDGDVLTFDRSNGDIVFEHRSGTTWTYNGTTDEMKLEHKSGSTITFDVLGNIVIDHALFLEDKGIAVIPNGQGPFCAIPTCPYSGAILQGQKVAPGV